MKQKKEREETEEKNNKTRPRIREKYERVIKKEGGRRDSTHTFLGNSTAIPRA